MKQDALEGIIAICAVVYAGGAVGNFVYASSEHVVPKRREGLTPDALAVWRAFRALLWPTRMAWYIVVAGFLTARALLRFTRWMVPLPRKRPPDAIPPARVVSQ